MSKIALVLGATGGIGGAVAQRLQNTGWMVRALARKPETIEDKHGYGWIQGDALCRNDVMHAANGASLIVHAVNPPGYRDWEKLVLPMLDNTIAAARDNAARVLLPGTVYNFGTDVLDEIGEDAPQNPCSRKGHIRVAMESRLRDLAASGEGSALIVRAGDFFGPGAANNWFSQGMVKPGKPIRAITYPGYPGVGHQWAYLPDVADVMVALLGREDLAPFARFHMRGHWDHDGRQMINAIRRVAGRPGLPIRRLPWFVIGLAASVVPLFRELAEIKYLWQRSLVLSNANLLAALGEEPRTPLDEAVRATLMSMGALENPSHPENSQAPLSLTSNHQVS